ncbi:hypothetical protein [Bradyrhizobium tropiciagri]|uniref:hypothetical protein n=1 Tax=Bradyrhizobium tropiciagri TaxID=312253 RepID=UPI000A4721E3|nr:hypothetical protein [Bradyrhizobium tropiciagri]
MKNLFHRLGLEIARLDQHLRDSAGDERACAFYQARLAEMHGRRAKIRRDRDRQRKMSEETTRNDQH